MRRVLAVVCLLVACTSASPAIDSTSPPGTIDSSPVTNSTQNGPTTSTAGGTVPTSTTEAVVDNDPFFPGLQLSVISLLTPPSGEGARPMLSWEPVEGAAHLYGAGDGRRGQAVVVVVRI